MSADTLTPQSQGGQGGAPAKKQNPWMWVAIALGVVLIAVAIYYFTSANAKVTVPDVVGKQQVDAVQALNEAGLVLGDVSVNIAEGVPEGTVAEQNPTAGTEVDEGAKVDLVVSGGVGTVVVPDVVGKTESEAEQLLTALGLEVAKSREYYDTVASGTVYAQVPDAGADAAPGSTAAILISRGTAPAKSTVPDVVGKKQADAEKALADAGFEVTVVDAYSDTVAKGVVGGQLPEAGAKVTPESEVSIYVSLGKGTAASTVPDVVGMTEQKAVDALKAAGLTSKVYQDFSDTVPAGTVFAQTPPAGSTTAAGTQVGIGVSLGKDTSTVTVPEVIGMSSEDASSTIIGVGLVPLAVPAASEEPSGTVTKQLPVKDSKVPAGSQLLYLVSTGIKPQPK